MTPNDKKEIIAYLSGPRDWSEGVQLYDRFGQNLRLKRQFAIDNTTVTREIMYDELRKLAGLSEMQFAALPRRAATSRPQLAGKTAKLVIIDDQKTDDIDDQLQELADSFGVTVDELVSPDFQERVLAMDENADRIEELEEELAAARSKYAEAPEPMRKMIRFREKYPFLNAPDCPDVLKIGVADMFTAYANFKDAHRRLQQLGDDPDAIKAAADCETVVTEYLKNRDIWEELEHYRTTGQILGKAEKFRTPEPEEKVEDLEDSDLIKQLQSARANTSKHKAAVTKAATAEARAKAQTAFDSWNARREVLQAEADRRKKK